MAKVLGVCQGLELGGAFLIPIREGDGLGMNI
jgi:hypothetical protein